MRIKRRSLSRFKTCRRNADFSFDRLLRPLCDERGVVIYPGKITDADTFRIGCIGAIDRDGYGNMPFDVVADLY